VREVLNGINATIFAYGQTGSGKTYSMFCGDTFENRGIVPRCLTQLFKELAMSDNAKVQISFTEVFNEQVYDLLDAEKKSTPKDKWQPVQLLDTGDGGILLKGLNVYEVPEEEDALSLFFMGYTNRASCSTHMNAHSSRSHAIFSISLETQAKQDGLMITSYSKLNLVDLAGSERVFKAEKSEELRTQGRRINLSLHHLEHTIVTLRDKNVRQAKRQKATSGQDLNDSALSSNSRSKLSPIAGSGDKGGDAAAKDHIPYRNSVLTWLLRDSLGGNCRSAFLVTCSLNPKCFDETISTLRFGQRCGEIRVQVSANAEIELVGQVQLLKARVRELELANSELTEALETSKTQAELFAALTSRQVDMRLLDENEKNFCKTLLQRIVDSAKVQNLGNSSDFVHTHATLKASEKTMQDTLTQQHSAILSLDKAVLVELSAAMMKLVQQLCHHKARAHALNAGGPKLRVKMDSSHSGVTNNTNTSGLTSEPFSDDGIPSPGPDSDSPVEHSDSSPPSPVSKPSEAAAQRREPGAEDREREAVGGNLKTLTEGLRKLSGGTNLTDNSPPRAGSHSRAPQLSDASVRTTHTAPSTVPASLSPQRAEATFGELSREANKARLKEKKKTTKPSAVLSLRDKPPGGPLLEKANGYDSDHSDTSKFSVASRATAPGRSNHARYDKGPTRGQNIPKKAIFALPGVAVASGLRKGRLEKLQTHGKHDEKKPGHNPLKSTMTESTREAEEAAVNNPTASATAAEGVFSAPQMDGYSAEQHVAEAVGLLEGLVSPSRLSITGLHSKPVFDSETAELITAGAVFIKHCRMGSRQPRRVRVSLDLSCLIWSHLDSEQANSVPILNFARCVIAKNNNRRGGCLISLIARGQNKSQHFEYAELKTVTENRAMAERWCNALATLIDSCPSSDQAADKKNFDFRIRLGSSEIL
jgi:hypothetical protein